jgi:hypothetical protein
MTRARVGAALAAANLAAGLTLREYPGRRWSRRGTQTPIIIKKVPGLAPETSTLLGQR